MADLLLDDDEILSALNRVKTIALLGASPNAARPSFVVMEFLLRRGYKVIPVNPGQAGKEILGQKVYARLADIDEPIDMIDIFRNVDAVPAILDEVLALPHKPHLFWMQLGIADIISAKRAIEAGINVVMDRCPHIELEKFS